MNKPSESILDQLKLMEAKRNVQEIFADGKPHTVTVINAVFIDGVALNDDINKPLIVERVATSAEQFDETLTRMMDALMKTFREATIPMFAVARAALVFTLQVYKGGPMATPEVQEAFELIANALGLVSGNPDALEMGMLLPPEARKVFSDYLARVPVPAVPDSLKEKWDAELAKESEA